MKPEYELLLSLVRETMGTKEFSEGAVLNADQLSALTSAVSLAKEHDVLPIVAEALGHYNLPEEYLPLTEKLTKHKFTAVYRTTSILSEQSDVSAVLADAGIEFILLKGAVIRRYYPSPWMRTSSDIDILLHHRDIDRAVKLLADKLEYSFVCRSAHDVSVESPSGVHVELHFILIESERMKASSEILSNVWEYAVKEKDSTEYILADKMYYYYHIAHMAKHFINGGCGLRSFIDLWIMDNFADADKVQRLELLKAGGLDSFAREASRLASVWLDGAEHTDTSRKIENYILPAGVYGVVDNMVAIGAGQNGGKFGYLMSRLFIPYEDLKNRYPKMGKYKILLPVMQIRRWLALLNPARGKRAREELKTVSNTQSDKLGSAAELIEILKI